MPYFYAIKILSFYVTLRTTYTVNLTKQLSTKSLLNFVLVCIGIHQKIKDTSTYIVYKPIVFI